MATHRHWPERVNERGDVACSCGRVLKRRETLHKRLRATSEGYDRAALVLARLRAFWR